jgi:hypothetical protein
MEWWVLMKDKYIVEYIQFISMSFRNR